MKKNKLLIPILSAAATVGLSLPAIATITSCSCSCSKKKNKFAGEDVTDEVQKPSFEPLTSAGPLHLMDGSKTLSEFYEQNPKAPIEEFMWTSSSWAHVVKNLLEEEHEELGMPALGKVNKWTAKMSDLELNDVSDQLYANYTITQDINIDLDVKGETDSKTKEEVPFLSGHVRLAWRNNIHNMPMNCFDFDPTGGKTIYDTETMWYMAPDMNIIPEEPESNDGWSIDYDILMDVSLKLMDEQMIKIDQEIQFPLNSDMAGVIETFEEKPVAYFIEKLLGVASGWNSYYLSQTDQYAHIDWENSKWREETQINDDINEVQVSLAHNAICDYKVEDEIYADDDSVYPLLLGIDTNNISLLNITILPAEVEASVIGEPTNDDPILSVMYDWRSNQQRPERNTSIINLCNQSVIGYNYLLPVLVSKDWISIGRLPTEENDLTDSDIFTINELEKAVVAGPSIGSMFDAERTEADEPFESEPIPFEITEDLYNAFGGEDGKTLDDWENGQVTICANDIEAGGDEWIQPNYSESKVSYNSGKYYLNLVVDWYTPEIDAPIPPWFSVRFEPKNVGAYQTFGEQQYTLDIGE